MGLRYTLRLYKGTDADAFRRAAEWAAQSLGGSILWDRPGAGRQGMRVASSDDVHSLHLEDHRAGDFCEEIGARLGVPWIELRIQEGSLWDYCLYRDGLTLDTFSVCPQYWDGDATADAELKQWQGRPDVLAREWGLPVERIRNYLLNWGYRENPDSGTIEFERDGKAYPTDEHPYGDYEQFFDVLRALGGKEPLERHTLDLPDKT
jgi:hypothetical protein